MRKPLIALTVAIVASVGSVILCGRAMGPDTVTELTRIERPEKDEYAVVFSRDPAGIVGPTMDREYMVCMEGPAERASHRRGAVMWESVEVAPDSIAWVAVDSLRVWITQGGYDRQHRESIRAHRRRGVVVTTTWLAEGPHELRP